jgi:hypothetical protein
MITAARVGGVRFSGGKTESGNRFLNCKLLFQLVNKNQKVMSCGLLFVFSLRMLKFFSFLLFFFTVMCSRAQFTDSSKYYLGYAGTGIINKTEKSKSYVFKNGVQGNANGKHLFLSSTFSWIYGEINEALSNNDFETVLDLNYKPDSSKMVYWVLGTFDKSYSLKIDKRFQVGGGLSYDIIRNSGMRINISDGLLYESGDLILASGIEDLHQTWRNSLRLKYVFRIKDIFSVTGTHFLQNSLAAASDYNIKSASALTLKIYKWVGFTTVLNYNKINRLKTENMLVTIGLTVQKYF